MDAIYSSLALPTPSSIRLLELFPSLSQADPVRIRLQVTDLNQTEEGDGLHTQFEALSYTWGSPNDPLPITVLPPATSGQDHRHGNADITVSEEKAAGNDQGVTMMVTQNLHSALTRLRQSTASRTFWIDAVCINQADLKERAAQVKIMIRIYQQATLVTADLGNWNGGNVDKLFGIMHALGKLVDERLETDDHEVWTVDKFERLGLPAWDDDAWAEWNEFLSLNYFTRVWVVRCRSTKSKSVLLTSINPLRFKNLQCRIISYYNFLSFSFHRMFHLAFWTSWRGMVSAQIQDLDRQGNRYPSTQTTQFGED
jgi:Heterokaryon incompatibility protein (HET)